MNQLVKFNTEDYSYDDKRLKIILYNIIEYMGQKRKLSIRHAGLDPEDAHAMIIRIAKKYYVYDMYSFDSNYNFATDNMIRIKMVDEFLNAFNISNHLMNIGRFIVITLHEIGHIDLYDMYRDLLSKFKVMTNTIENILYLVTPINDQDDQLSVQCLEMEELYADQFAYKYFWEVWNMLVYRGLI